MSLCTKFLRQSIKIWSRRAHSGKNPKKVYPQRIFSGIQPTGTIHLGNYLGAIKEWVRLQDAGEAEVVIWSIVDMHAITIPKNIDELRDNILKMTALLLAAGIDPEKSILYQQSMVPMHAQLHWVLGCMTTMPKLSLLPQLKEKSALVKDVSLGLFSYPVLQTADILLYKATHVPVGEDQLQHLHLAQHLVNFFNGKFGETFPTPQPLINTFGGRIKSLREPTKKMSKSSEYKKSCITLIDPPEIIREYIKKSVTDFKSEVTYDPEERPGVSNLITIHSMMVDKPPEMICQEAESLNTGQYKLLVADVVIEKLTPIREKYEQLMSEPQYLYEVLRQGSLKALPLAEESWLEIKEKIGFSSKDLSSNIMKERIKTV